MPEQIKQYPLLPLRDVVVFPKMIVPLFVGREKSIKAIKQLQKKKSHIVLVSQKDASVVDPKAEDLYNVGVLSKVIQTLTLPDGTLKILIEAIQKVKIHDISYKDGFFQSHIMHVTNISKESLKTNALLKFVQTQFKEYSKLNTKINQEVFSVLDDIKDPDNLADVIASNLETKIEKKQKLLEINDTGKKLKELSICLEYEINLLKTEYRIRDGVKKQMESTHREYFLNEQLKAIQRELGSKDGEGGKTEIALLEEKIKKTKFSKEAKEKANSELNKLKMMNAMSSEATIVRNYLETLLSLPWKKYSKLKHDLNKAEKVLDRDHYALKDVKERILEFLAVQRRTKSSKGPILCFVGPPGVGKTSLAKSIAEATGRELVQFALGGLKDESEIRGHRKTYLGAMPGKIISLLKKANTSNPVMLLDEIDKVGSDYRGDPSSALLEVLDPAQNDKFVDNYIETEFDLSQILFIATANSMDIQRALLDRMEIIRVSGYTEGEKFHIANKHLIRKQMKEHQLLNKEFKLSEKAVLDIIRHYTKEAGVRSLNRALEKIMRKTVRLLEKDDKKSMSITPKNLEDFLGVHKFEYGKSETKDIVGTVTGLAYTDFGGELLSIESVVLPGKGEIKATGKLGEVMQESAQTAYSYFKSTSLDYGIIPPRYSSKNIHLHVPEGATPKDGPSAGIAILTSIVSSVTGIPVDKNVAMTGEITLRGRVLPIGGLKEKLLAASRGGIKTVLIPYENKKDISEIPKNIITNLQIIPVKTASEVLQRALTSTFVPIKWSENEKVAGIMQKNGENDIVTH
jgi:ATP-dependent Lon protease